jgi:hypothetical protein
MSYLSPKMARASTLSALTIIIVLALALLTSVGMQTNSTAQNTVFQEQIRGNFVDAFQSIEEGNIRTDYYASAFTDPSGEIAIILSISKIDTTTDSFVFGFFGFGPADQLTVANDLSTATFSGTVTAIEDVTGEEMTFTVDADLTATGKPERYGFKERFITPDFKALTNVNGKVRPASGSLDISGEGMTFSTDDASGTIAREIRGLLAVEKVR